MGRVIGRMLALADWEICRRKVRYWMYSVSPVSFQLLNLYSYHVMSQWVYASSWEPVG